MTDKPVTVTLEDDDGENIHVVHSCDTIQQAEEWIAERGETDRERVEAGKYGIDAPEGMMDDYASGANGATDTTEVDATPPLNNLSRLRDLLDRVYENTAARDALGHEMAAEIDDALDDIWTEQEYDVNPEVREFDEIVSQGRAALLDWIAEGRPAPDLIEPLRMVDEGRDDIVVGVPLRSEDAAAVMRRVSSETVTAIGFGAASFAAPGLRDLLAKLDFGSKIPTPDQHGDPVHDDGGFAHRAVTGATIDMDAWKALPHTRRAISRASLQLVAR